jgi:hypothetical protein
MKLSPLTIYIVGGALFVILVSFGFFHHWMPNNAEIESNRVVLEQLTTEGNKLPAAKKRVDDAIADLRAADRAWQAIVVRKTPSSSLGTGGIDLTVNRWQLSVDTRKFRNNVQRALNRQLRQGGVEVISGPYVPGIGENDSVNTILANYFQVSVYNFPIVIYDLGQVQVRGTYEQIMANVRAYSNMPNWLAVADGLSISGTSPILNATYNLQLVGFIRGKELSTDVPELATGGGGIGGPGGFGPGGPGGGFGPGGPGGGPPRGPAGVGGAGGDLGLAGGDEA